ncbi:MAG TPA: hypothetical protein VFY71_10885 [Planctomycetota bacterium]|nr:hypothetical protein [Planctomycetota bacterium]
MKNPSIAAAFVLVALSLLVGGLALASGGDEPVSGDAQVLTASAEPVKASFETLSPHELRKRGRMEEAQRELAKIRRVGEEVLPNVFRIKDETGDATLYYGDLIPGVGRNGEPLYLMAQYKKLPAVPLKTPKFAPKSATKFKKDPIKALKFDKPPKDGDGSGGGAGGGGAGGGQHGGGKSVGGTGGG